MVKIEFAKKEHLTVNYPFACCTWMGNSLLVPICSLMWRSDCLRFSSNKGMVNISKLFIMRDSYVNTL